MAPITRKKSDNYGRDFDSHVLYALYVLGMSTTQVSKHLNQILPQTQQSLNKNKIVGRLYRLKLYITKGRPVGNLTTPLVGTLLVLSIAHNKPIKEYLAKHQADFLDRYMSPSETDQVTIFKDLALQHSALIDADPDPRLREYINTMLRMCDTQAREPTTRKRVRRTKAQIQHDELLELDDLEEAHQDSFPPLLDEIEDAEELEEEEVEEKPWEKSKLVPREVTPKTPEPVPFYPRNPKPLLEVDPRGCRNIVQEGGTPSSTLMCNYPVPRGSRKMFCTHCAVLLVMPRSPK